MAEALDPALPPALDTLAKQVLNEACDRGLMLVTAESCTGGLLASLLTDIPGSSHAFDRGFVTYTAEAKHELLGVPLEVLAERSAVSKERSAGRKGRSPWRSPATQRDHPNAARKPALCTSPAPAPAAPPSTARNTSATSAAPVCASPRWRSRSP